MKILIIDNYDSFTYNLYQVVGEIVKDKMHRFSLQVKRNDDISIKDIQKAGYSHIIISPGPGNPCDTRYFGVCAQVLLKISKTISTLGVCLGMQGMAHYFGGTVLKAKIPMHGKTSIIVHDEKGVFTGLPQDLEVMRYHSLVVDPLRIPSCLQVSARVKESDCGEGAIMGLRHRDYPIEGVQFHPESFATEGGNIMLTNFLFRT